MDAGFSEADSWKRGKIKKSTILVKEDSLEDWHWEGSFSKHINLGGRAH